LAHSCVIISEGEKKMKTLYKQTWVKILCSLIIVFVLAFGLTGTVNAMEYINSGVIRANDIIDDDAFVTGQNVVVDGTVTVSFSPAGLKF
jgi:hypothetical protein